jgi:hypothetical protein
LGWLVLGEGRGLGVVAAAERGLGVGVELESVDGGVVVGLAAGVETGLARTTGEGTKEPTRNRNRKGKSNKISTRVVIFLNRDLLGVAMSRYDPRDSIRPSIFL